MDNSDNDMSEEYSASQINQELDMFFEEVRQEFAESFFTQTDEEYTYTAHSEEITGKTQLWKLAANTLTLNGISISEIKYFATFYF